MAERLPSTVYQRRLVVLAAAGVLAVMAAAMVGWSTLRPGEATTDPARTAPLRSEVDARPSTTSAVPSTTATPTTSAPTTTTTTPTGRFQLASGGTGLVGAGRIYRYRVEVEEGTGIDVAEFAADVDRILGDPRGWTTADGISLQRVADDTADFSVRLATPTTTDVLCLPLDTQGQVSCGRNEMAVINLTRWREGAAPSALSVDDYQAYVVTHEVGHLIGHGHEACPGPGQRATTMMQQTYSIGECTPNPWPVPDA